MDASRMQIGVLVPLRENLAVDDSVPSIPILEGANVLGRENVAVSDKRVSRKHLTLHALADGSAEVLVEGPNPIVVKSEGERKKLCNLEKSVIVHGDILELLPKMHLFRYEVVRRDHTTSPRPNPRISAKEKRPGKEAMAVKRKRNADDDAFSEGLQDTANLVESSSTDQKSLSELATNLDACDDTEAIRHFNAPRDRSSLTFQLMRTQGLPSWVNTSSVAIEDVIQGNVLVAVLSNYMVDIDWLLAACPALRKIPHVLLVHGETGATVDHLKKNKPANWILYKPPLPISFGTHHSKAMLLVYPKGVRVVVHTANLISVDWNNKTQGLWMQDFPRKDDRHLGKKCPFEDDLVDYLNMLKWPEFRVNLPDIGNASFNGSFFKNFDYSNTTVRLIASVPGYHVSSNMKKWGHLKLRSVLEGCTFDKEFCRSPLAYQFSSLGSLDERWLAELAFSMSSGMSDDKSPLGTGTPCIIWPTVEDVRCSLEGYAAGNAIPSPQKNVEKDFLKKYWSRWRANHVGRCRAMPHIKTYTRYNGQSLAWFLLTSSNLSKAAWGALQKNNTQLMIRSYELGVLFLPSAIRKDGSWFSCTENGAIKQEELSPPATTSMQQRKTKLATLCWKEKRNAGDDSPVEVIRLPVPYHLPPQPYSSEDVPWSWDRRYTKKDVYGQTWPRHVQLYSSQDLV